MAEGGTKVCKSCGAVFVSCSTSGPAPVYCGVKCRRNARNVAYRERWRVKRELNLICAQCGCSFQWEKWGRGGQPRYCSNGCRAAFNADYMARYSAAYYHAVIKPDLEKLQAIRANQKRYRLRSKADAARAISERAKAQAYARKWYAERMAADPEYAKRASQRRTERMNDDPEYRSAVIARRNRWKGRRQIAWAEFKLRKALEELNQNEGNANGHASND